MTIRDFRQLQELQLKVTRPSPVHDILLSSISSIELRKILFVAERMNDREPFAPGMERWTLIDEQLCRLVDRLRVTGYRRTLEVELRLTDAGEFPITGGFTKLLPAFREKGVVTITDAAYEGRMLHSSNRNHGGQ